MKTTGALSAYNFPSCRGFADQQSACSFAEQLTATKRGSVRYIILTGNVFFASDTGDVQPYEKLLFVYQFGVQYDKALAEPKNNDLIGERTYTNKYKTSIE